MRTLVTRLPLVLLLVVVTACASSAGPQTGERPVRRDANRITRAELAQSHTNDAFEAIRTMRPNWLRKRGQLSVTQSSDIIVYLDNVQLGGPELLRNIPIISIQTMQFLDAASATQRWGTNHVHGAILVTTM